VTIRKFIRRNRAELDQVIRSAGYRGKLNDQDREEWISNEESLYLWAKRAGVLIALLLSMSLPAHAWPHSSGGSHGWKPRSVHAPRPHAPKPHVPRPPRPRHPR
jgi:hypothetical protein